LVLRAAQDTLFRGAGNKTWSDSAGAGDDNQTAAANSQWKARNGRKIWKEETALMTNERP